MIRAFKVVQSKQDRYYSVRNELKESLEYQVGRWTEPALRGSQLFVFDNAEHAKLFQASMQIWNTLKIESWVCECPRLEKIGVVDLNTAPQRFWTHWERSTPYPWSPYPWPWRWHNAPVGSCITHAVRLLERLA